MAIIEKVGNIIRPGFLPVQLTANIIAGHLLILIDCRLLNASSLCLLKFYLISFFIKLILLFQF